MPASLEYRLLEASLFESAALLWNDTATSEVQERATPGDGKLPTKRYRELQRSTIRAIFALIEGYLNGIAYDIELTTDLATLSAGAREMVLERTDDAKTRFKTLREKIFAYPRIALGLEHSPVLETQADVAWILQKEKELRDAIVHPTPRAEQHRALIREQVYYDTDFAGDRRLHGSRNWVDPSSRRHPERQVWTSGSVDTKSSRGRQVSQRDVLLIAVRGISQP